MQLKTITLINLIETLFHEGTRLTTTNLP